MTSKQKKKLIYAFLIYYVIWFLASTHVVLAKQSEQYLMVPVAALTCVLVPIGLKLIHMQATFEIYIVNLIFAGIASIGGTLLGGYAIPYFDKFLHFSSGILITALALMLYSTIKQSISFSKQNEQWIVLLFINAMNMMIAVFWEFFEFGCLVFLENDAIRHTTTGVYDSMTDMLVAMVGGWILTSFVLHYFHTSRKNFWIRLNEQFFEKNCRK